MINYKRYNFHNIIMNNTNCPLGEYSNIFGLPGEGLHSYRLFNLAIVDVALTVLVSGIISYIFKYNFIVILLLLFLLAIILHRLFCVNTTINKLIFGEIS